MLSIYHKITEGLVFDHANHNNMDNRKMSLLSFCLLYCIVKSIAKLSLVTTYFKLFFDKKYVRLTFYFWVKNWIFYKYIFFRIL